MKTAATLNLTAPVAAETTGAPAPRRRILRRVGAVFAGLITIFAVTTAVDLALHATGVFTREMSGDRFLLAVAYRIVIGVLGCYVTARLAPDRPVRHALVLGGVGVVLATAGAIAMWDAGPGWYSLAVIAISLPCAWAGGRLRARQLRDATAR
jgi:hypothetical protein